MRDNKINKKGESVMGKKQNRYNEVPSYAPLIFNILNFYG